MRIGAYDVRANESGPVRVARTVISGSPSTTAFGSRAASGTAAAAAAVARSSVAHVSHVFARTRAIHIFEWLELPLAVRARAHARGTDSVFIYKPAKSLPNAA